MRDDDYHRRATNSTRHATVILLIMIAVWLLVGLFIGLSVR